MEGIAIRLEAIAIGIPDGGRPWPSFRISHSLLLHEFTHRVYLHRESPLSCPWFDELGSLPGRSPCFYTHRRPRKDDEIRTLTTSGAIHLACELQGGYIWVYLLQNLPRITTPWHAKPLPRPLSRPPFPTPPRWTAAPRTRLLPIRRAYVTRG